MGSTSNLLKEKKITMNPKTGYLKLLSQRSKKKEDEESLRYSVEGLPRWSSD